MKKFVVIVAGGSGSRMKSDIPKQFLVLNGIPVLMHTIQKFHKSFNGSITVILVLPVNQHTYWNELCEKYNFDLPHIIAGGGNSRMHSVENGLKKINEEGIVAIHDGVRPLISEEVIRNSFYAAEKHGSGVVCVPPKDSLRKISDNNRNITQAVNRSDYLLVQTPQTFRVKDIKEAFVKADNYNFTDDASVYENAGQNIHVIIGNYDNIKITTPEDLVIAESLIGK
ncbi:2-C-methyl-D-erythritol 4-phosphate cytidylyltransferase [Mangrovivirga sp. M17]|uniref:2-C-methyl-D-erythritol 4-phosphate cytidylyltransferase n=1 Tax=Mangrovivirga halotolerans TaxID=2993936 RepID=A0ABT3RUG0_9BACT|nr:2-C-methyl-D-erythritol 4-phosphate cytidylyltransferase [Mangrovivirga halotolerans]MCX2745146.1 2-C-methyl-D-erythritol 4-phosphate cytidylyltransferase [Mangrovivirga halotolerans]